VKYEYGYEKEETGDWVPENFQIRAMFRHDGLNDLKPYTSRDGLWFVLRYTYLRLQLVPFCYCDRLQ
jgi:hypothetical protein